MVESTFNRYWLVDGPMDNGYKVHLAHPAAFQQYSGLKHTDDEHDAFFLAKMLKLGILPEGHIMPREERQLRNLLRKRMKLARQRRGQGPAGKKSTRTPVFSCGRRAVQGSRCSYSLMSRWVDGTIALAAIYCCYLNPSTHLPFYPFTWLFF